MTEYILLNSIFLIASGVLYVLFKSRVNKKAMTAALIITLLLSIIFDPLIIHFGIVAYDHTKLLGASIAGAPIEDLCYAVVSAIVVPIIWSALERHSDA